MDSQHKGDRRSGGRKGYEATRLRGYEATRLRGCEATRLRGYEATRPRGCEAARPQGYEATARRRRPRLRTAIRATARAGVDFRVAAAGRPPGSATRQSRDSGRVGRPNAWGPPTPSLVLAVRRGFGACVPAAWLRSRRGRPPHTEIPTRSPLPSWLCRTIPASPPPVRTEA